MEIRSPNVFQVFTIGINTRAQCCRNKQQLYCEAQLSHTNNLVKSSQPVSAPERAGRSPDLERFPKQTSEQQKKYC